MTQRLHHLPALLQFGYLQLLDLLTTVAFLLQGVPEGNPMVRAAMQLAPDALLGLVAVKAAALILGLYCWGKGRTALLARINIMFAALIAWNLVALIVGSARVTS